MSELNPLITHLALILVLAGAGSLLFKWLKQPVVLAYIVAGIVMSFFITKHSVEYEAIETWAEIGIIFLLFGLGLEFSFKKLIKVGPTAFISTVFVVVSMMGLGYLTGLAFGWSHLTSFFLGAMLSMSSTMIIIKVFEDLHLTKKNFAGIVLGMLIIEDLVAVLLMVMLSTIGVSQKFQGQEMLFSLFKLIAFLLFWFVLGTFLIPTFLRKMKKYLNDETLLIVVLSFCLGMVFLATKAGFSAALGAFIMGSILAETLDAERIEGITIPIKNFFGAIFFVSVGMMIDVHSVGAHIIPIIIISCVVILGQMVFATTGILLAGQSLKTAVSAGFSLTQIGEFSYIIGALGLSLGVIDSSLYQIIVSVSVITIFVTPFMMKLAEPANKWLERHVPDRWQSVLNRTVGVQPVNQNTLWKRFLRKVIVDTLIYYLLSIIIVVFGLNYGVPFVQTFLPTWQANLLSAALLLIIIAPFQLLIITKQDHSDEFVKLWRSNKGYRAPLLCTIILRILMCCALIMYVLVKIFHTHAVLTFVVAVVVLILLLISRRLRRETAKIERRFRENLNEKEEYEESLKPVTQGFTNHLLERDLHLSDFLIQPYFAIVGKTLQELQFRQTYGVNVVTIVRGSKRINIPSGNERVYPGDHLIVFGTDKQIETFEEQIEETKLKHGDHPHHVSGEIVLKQIELEAGSPYIGETLSNSRIRSDYDCMIVGIERNGGSILNPSINLSFEEGDVLWIVGENRRIKRLRDSLA